MELTNSIHSNQSNWLRQTQNDDENGIRVGKWIKWGGGSGEEAFTSLGTVAREVIDAVDATSAVEAGPLRALVDVYFADVAAESFCAFADKSLFKKIKKQMNSRIKKLQSTEKKGKRGEKISRKINNNKVPLLKVQKILQGSLL